MILRVMNKNTYEFLMTLAVYKHKVLQQCLIAHNSWGGALRYQSKTSMMSSPQIWTSYCSRCCWAAPGRYRVPVTWFIDRSSLSHFNDGAIFENRRLPFFSVIINQVLPSSCERKDKQGTRGRGTLLLYEPTHHTSLLQVSIFCPIQLGSSNPNPHQWEGNSAGLGRYHLPVLPLGKRT